MKKLMLVCCFVLGATAISFAQGGGGGGQGGGRQQMKPEDQAKALQTSLKLTDDQTAKVKAIYVAQAAKRDSVTKAAGDDRQGIRTAMQPIQTATTAKIQALLTDEQKEAWKKIQAERGQGRGGRNGGQGGATTPPATTPPTK